MGSNHQIGLSRKTRLCLRKIGYEMQHMTNEPKDKHTEIKEVMLYHTRRYIRPIVLDEDLFTRCVDDESNERLMCCVKC